MLFTEKSTGSHLFRESYYIHTPPSCYPTQNLCSRHILSDPTTSHDYDRSFSHQIWTPFAHIQQAIVEKNKSVVMNTDSANKHSANAEELAKEEDEKKKTSNKKKSSSGKSGKKDKDPTSPPPSPKKDSKSSKKKSSGSSKNKDKEKKSAKGHKDEKLDKDKTNKDTDDVVDDDEDTVRMLSLLTDDFWTTPTPEATTAFMTALYELLEKKAGLVKLSVEVGAPLLVVRKMKDFSAEAAVQSAALQLLKFWSDNTEATSWYPLLIRLGGLVRVQDILTADSQDDAFQASRNDALMLLEGLSSSAAKNALIQNAGIISALLHANLFENEKFTARVTEILYQLANDGRDKVTAVMNEALSKDSATVTCQTNIFDFFIRLMNNESTKSGFVPYLIGLSGWECLRKILTEGSKAAAVNEEIATLQDKSMTLLEMMASSSDAAVLVQHQGVETLKSIVQGRNGALIPRALEVLYLLSATTGTDGRCKITEEMGELLRECRDVRLQSAIISLMSEMAVDEATAEGLVKGQGIETLVLAWELCRADRAAVSDKALDLILLLAVKCGGPSQKAIAESGILTTIAKIMKDEPANDTVHTRGRQLATALRENHGPLVDETSILTM